MKTPGPDHPITVTPTDSHVTVRAGNRVVADTTAALSLAEAGYPVAQYIPLADVDQSVLRPSETATSCPFKGEASYYSIVVDGQELIDSVWTYREPYPAVASIAGHVAFYPAKVQVTVGED